MLLKVKNPLGSNLIPSPSDHKPSPLVLLASQHMPRKLFYRATPRDCIVSSEWRKFLAFISESIFINSSSMVVVGKGQPA